MHYYIENQTWKTIFAFLNRLKGFRTSEEPSLRQFIEAIWYMCRTGYQWRLLPKQYGFWRSIHRRFKLWSDKEIWLKLFEYGQTNPDLESCMIDATIIGSVASVACQSKWC